MKVVLRNNVDGVGKRGDIVDVSDGYGRNFLIPKGLAMRATSGTAREAEAMRRVEAQRDEQSRTAAQELATRIGGIPMVIAARASEEGKLFGDAMAHNGVEIDRRVVQLDEPIKDVGDHSVTLVLHPEVTMAISVSVIAED